MPYDVRWDDDTNTIILCRIEGDFSLLSHIADMFREFDALANTVEHKVGVIIDWAGFQPIVPGSNSNTSQTEGRRGILRGDFGSSGGIHLVGMTQKENPPPPKIAIMVFVLPESTADNFRNAISPMLAVSTSQAQFAATSSIEEAREMIQAHFQQGHT